MGDKPSRGLAGFEDIGWHVALHKLLRFRAKQRDQEDAVIASNRPSDVMVRRLIYCDVEILYAFSAPTALAVKMGSESRLTLLDFCGHKSGIIYTTNKCIVVQRR